MACKRGAAPGEKGPHPRTGAQTAATHPTKLGRIVDERALVRMGVLFLSACARLGKATKNGPGRCVEGCESLSLIGTSPSIATHPSRPTERTSRQKGAWWCRRGRRCLGGWVGRRIGRHVIHPAPLFLDRVSSICTPRLPDLDEMAQKEVIHLTLGTLSQHISTHFFNQQSSHFQYDEMAGGSSSSRDKGDDLLLDPNVDFQEGIGSRRNEQTFFPREVVVGFKGQMGTGWDAYNVTLEDGNDDGNDDDDDNVLRPSNAVNEGLHAWSLPAELMRTEAGGRVTRTRTQWHGDDDDDEKELSASEDEGEEGPIVERTELDSDRPLSRPTIRPGGRARYRTPASYAHNALHPRSLHALPRLNGSGVLLPMGEAAGEGQSPFSSFEMGMLLAREMERSSSLTEDSIRWFAEDSDSLQSFHLTTCTSDGFAGITHEVMQSLADEFPKTPVIAWGAQWGHDDYNAEGNEGVSSARRCSKVAVGWLSLTATHLQRLGRQRHMNNILSLWSLSSASLYVPLRVPAQLQGTADVKAKTLHHFSSRATWTDEYQAAALLSAHIDTSTLRMR